MWYVPGTKINGMYVRTPTEPVTTIAVAYNVNQLTFTLAEATTLYLDFYGEPLSELAEQMLHTMYFDRSSDINNKIKKGEN